MLMDPQGGKMDNSQLKPIIESMIFVSEEPLTDSAIAIALADAGVEKAQVCECVAEIEKEWNENPARGIGLSKVAGGYQFRTKEECAEWLRRLAIPKPMRLSGPALETMAIVAYRQPIMRSEVEKIRGVDSGGVLKTLLERKLLRIVGRSQEPGQPLLYGTTKEFLEIFNLNTLKDLPTLKDLDDLMRERREQLGASAGAKAQGSGDDEEDLTEVIGSDEEEEETEVIKRRPLDEGEENEEDMEALSELESQIKGLRRLEREFFPSQQEESLEAVENPVQEEGGNAQDGTGKMETTSEKEAPEAAAVSTENPAAGEDAPPEVYRPVE